jgi:glyoxylase-like metal-dependent hydrolase (beta-lactamase superfamily II)
MYTIRPINTGFIPTFPKQYHFHHSVVNYIEGISDEKEASPCFTFLLEENGRYVLVDTGMADTVRAGKYHHPGSWQEHGQAIHEQLSKLGIRCEQIELIILTHMHWDHVYNIEKFCNARIIANKKEYDFALDPIPLYYKSYEAPFLGIKPPYHGLKIETVEGEKEVADGLTVFETPGHSPGHMSVEVNTFDGKYIICGDSAFRLENFQPIDVIGYTITPPARFADIVSCWKSIELQKERCESLDRLLLTHEFSLLERCKETPVIGLPK